ncbi:MAG: hypothetical protein PVG30_03715 [Gammaproteobacteria bacterium]
MGTTQAEPNETNFVAVGTSYQPPTSNPRGIIFTSQHGGQWVERKLPSSAVNITKLKDVEWNKTQSKWVAVGNGVLVSIDGITWEDRMNPSLASPIDLNGVACNGSQWIAVGNDHILTSTQGNVWTVQDIPFPRSSLYGITWDDKNKQWVAVGESFDYSQAGGIILTSSDGTHWVKQAVPKTIQPSGSINHVIWNGHQLVAVGRTNDSSVPAILTSNDGVNWTEQAPPKLHINNYEQGGIAWNNKQWMIVGVIWTYDSSKGIAITSKDSTNWTLSKLGDQFPDLIGGFQSIAWNGTRWVILGMEDNQGTPNSIVLTNTHDDEWVENSLPYSSEDIQLAHVAAGPVGM